MAKELKRAESKGKAAARRSWELRLYVAGQTPRCVDAFANLKRICEEHLAGRYRIEVVDLMKGRWRVKGSERVKGQ